MDEDEIDPMWSMHTGLSSNEYEDSGRSTDPSVVDPRQRYRRGLGRFKAPSPKRSLESEDFKYCGGRGNFLFLRAIHDFQPPPDRIASFDGSSAVIVSIFKGDVVLVHSIQANGWAHGMVLRSGAEGWLPTNYCKTYEEEAVAKLLEALVKMLRVVRMHEEDEDEDENEMQARTLSCARCMTRGVQRLLQRLQCLSRDAPLIVAHDGVGRARRTLLGQLSTLMQATRTGTEAYAAHDVARMAVNVAAAGVAMLDVWKRSVRESGQRRSQLEMPLNKARLIHNGGPRQDNNDAQQQNKMSYHNDADGSAGIRDLELSAASVPAVVRRGPLDGELQRAEDWRSHPAVAYAGEHACAYACACACACACAAAELVVLAGPDDNKDASGDAGRQATTPTPDCPSTTIRQTRRQQQQQQQKHLHFHLHLTTVAPPAPVPASNNLPSHSIDSDSLALRRRLLLPPLQSTSPLPSPYPLPSTFPTAAPPHNALASQLLFTAHDSFIIALAALVGSRLRSNCAMDLLKTSDQSFASCQDLLNLINDLWERDGRRSTSLDMAREEMRTSIDQLRRVTRVFFDSPDVTPDHATAILPVHEDSLVNVATLCVRSASICFAETRSIIERIGDFDLGPLDLRISDVFTKSPTIGELDLSTDDSYVDIVDSHDDRHAFEESSLLPSRLNRALPALPHSVDRPSLPPLTVVSSTANPPPSPSAIYATSNPCTSAETVILDNLQSLSARSLVTRSPTVTIDLPQTYSGDFSQQRRSYVFNPDTPPRTDSMGASVTSTRLSSFRHSEVSILSQASTRATSPDQSPVQDSYSRPLHDSFGPFSESKTTLLRDLDEVEAQLLAETYAHELILNAEGQVRGGSLRALVERLTTYDTTPDAMFLNTFYLTFRLFTNPITFAQSLIHRFEYVGHNKLVGIPVRLRVYNVFKGWLETYWRSEDDMEALETIRVFAMGPLYMYLSSASKRLMELINKISNTKHRPLVPRLVSTMGKSNTAVTSPTLSDGPLPPPVINKNLLNGLRNAKHSSDASCNLLDIDPLELARQITLIKSGIYCQIEPEELLAQEWRKGDDSKSVNVRAMSMVTTDLANLVTDTVLQHEEPKKRATMIKYWVKVAKHARDLCNYDSLKAILIALDTSTIHRLKKTWDQVSPRTMARLEELRPIIDCSRNWNALRQLMKNHPAPCLPSVSNYLTDLAFIDEANTVDRLWRDHPLSISSLYDTPPPSPGAPTAIINFERYLLSARSIGEIQRFQIPYRLTPVPELQEWLGAQFRRVRELGDACGGDIAAQRQYRRSLLLEPRDGQQVLSGGWKERFEWRAALHLPGTLAMKER